MLGNGFGILEMIGFAGTIVIWKITAVLPDDFHSGIHIFQILQVMFYGAGVKAELDF